MYHGSWVLTYNSMRVRLLLCAVIASVLASSGCAARRPGGPDEFDALMRSWQGHTIDDLFRTWGRPVYLYSDGGSGRIAVYVPAAPDLPDFFRRQRRTHHPLPMARTMGVLQQLVARHGGHALVILPD